VVVGTVGAGKEDADISLNLILSCMIDISIFHGIRQVIIITNNFLIWCCVFLSNDDVKMISIA